MILPQLSPVATNSPLRSVFLVAGETSGDEHAAAVVRSLKQIDPNIEVFGMGGRKLREAGMETVIDSEHSASVMGFSEVVSKLRSLIGSRRLLLEQVAKRKPQLAILVDFPDFNFTLLKELSRQNVTVLYYVSPQLWAWRSGRIKKLKQYAAKIIPIFPFEENYYRSRGMEAQYLGHPLLDKTDLQFSREKFLQSLGLNSASPTVAILPGSRKAELRLLLPPMLAAIAKVRKARPGLQVLMPLASNLPLTVQLEDIAKENNVTIVKGKAREVLLSSDVGVVTSGTATLEAALCVLPFVAVYKMSGISHFIATTLVRGVSNFVIVNLIAGKKIVKELLQDEASADEIAFEIEKLLGDNDYRNQLKQELLKVREKLQFKIANNDAATSAERVAQAAIDLIGEGA